MKARIIIVSAVVAAVCSCSGNGPAAKSTEAAPVAVNDVHRVSVSTAVREVVSQDEVYSTSVRAYAINNIASQTAGRIKKLNVEVGDFVSAGQVLAEMDATQLSQNELQLKNQEVEFKRVKALFEQGGISQSDFDALELQYKVATATYENLKENTILRSPVTGVITARNYDKGDMYAMSSPVYTVQQITPVKLLVPVTETSYTKVRKGDKAEVTVDALPGKSYTGTVVRLHPTVDAVSHTFNVEITVPNANRELRPGMYARVVMNLGNNDSIVVPDSAIVKQQGSGQRGVYVLNEDGTVALRMVVTGRHFDGKYEILEGLEGGEKVVTKGNTTIKTGDKVEVA